MEVTITPIWVTTTSWDHQIPFEINVNYIIK
jgi:hypothetical protein